MSSSKSIATIVILIAFSLAPFKAEENVNPINKGENTKYDVSSPLVDQSTSAGYAQLTSLTYKASMSLYPIRIESINNFKIKPLLHGYEYSLAPGTYTLEVRPDFSLLNDLKPFMNSPFVIKKVEISVVGNKRYSIVARINPDQLNDWQVQLFDIQAAVATE